MLIVDKDFAKNIREKNLSQQELADHLVRNNTVYDLAMRLAEYMMKDTAPIRITLSEEEYQAVMNLFRIRGTRENGEQETRGRKSIRRED